MLCLSLRRRSTLSIALCDCGLTSGPCNKPYLCSSLTRACNKPQVLFAVLSIVKFWREYVCANLSEHNMLIRFTPIPTHLLSILNCIQIHLVRRRTETGETDDPHNTPCSLRPGVAAGIFIFDLATEYPLALLVSERLHVFNLARLATPYSAACCLFSVLRRAPGVQFTTAVV